MSAAKAKGSRSSHGRRALFRGNMYGENALKIHNVINALVHRFPNSLTENSNVHSLPEGQEVGALFASLKQPAVPKNEMETVLPHRFSQLNHPSVPSFPSAGHVETAHPTIRLSLDNAESHSVSQ